MHRLMAGVTILEHELSELRLLVERQTGILLDCPNSALAAHVADYLETHELESPAALLARLRAPDLDPAVVAEFLDGVLNTTTGFFRHPGAMNALARQVVHGSGMAKESGGGVEHAIEELRNHSRIEVRSTQAGQQRCGRFEFVGLEVIGHVGG